jgi:hypothetical protein
LPGTRPREGDTNEELKVDRLFGTQYWEYATTTTVDDDDDCKDDDDHEEDEDD